MDILVVGNSVGISARIATAHRGIPPFIKQFVLLVIHPRIFAMYGRHT